MDIERIDESLIHAILIAQDSPGSLQAIYDEYVKLGKHVLKVDEMEFCRSVEKIWRLRKPRKA